MRRALLVGSIAALLSGLAGSAAPAATTPHVLRFASAEEVATLNPDISQQLVVQYLNCMTAAYFFRYDKNDRMVPELATSVPSMANGGISKDGLTVTFHVRRGVKWSDGAPFDADDVVWTLGAIENPANLIPSRDGFDQIAKVDEPDKFTVVIHLKKTYGAIVPVMFGSAGGTAILPKHLLASLPDFNKADFNSLPVGIGPFRYAAWRRGDAIELERNPYYWRGQPALAKVVMKLLPDRNTVLVALQTGDIDMWYPFGGSFLARVQSIPNVKIVRHPGYGNNLIYFNLKSPKLADVAVRRAIRLGTDRKTLRDKIGHGVGLLQDVPLPLTNPDTPQDIGFTDFDPAKAKAILDAAGWKPGADGIRTKNGVALSLDMASSSGSPDTDSAIELIRAWWKDLGIEMNVQRYQSSMLFGPMDQGGILLGGKFDVMFLGRSTAIPIDPRGVFGCAAAPPEGQNAGHYCNPRFDAVLDKLDATYDESERKADVAKLFHILNDDVPVIVTTGREDLFGVSSSVRNFEPNSVTPFDDMMKVDI